jgi:hypothetical protein
MSDHTRQLQGILNDTVAVFAAATCWYAAVFACFESPVQMLMQGPQLQQVFAQVAAVLGISHAQLAVVLIRHPRFWDLVVPRHTWPCCPLSQQQQQQGPSTAQQQQQQQPAAAAAAAGVQLSPAAAQAAATLSALVNCGLRPPEVMQAAVVLNPVLLQLSPEAALGRVESLTGVCSRSPAWQQQLADSLSPLQLGQALVRAQTLDEKLLFLIQCGWAGRLYLGDAVQMTAQEFNGTFGVQFLHWRARRRRQQQQQRWRRERAAVAGPQQGQEQEQEQWEEADEWSREQEQLGLAGLSQQQQEHEQQQQQQQQQPGLPLAASGDAADAFVQALQAKLAGKPAAGGGDGAAAAAGGGMAASVMAGSSPLSSPLQQQQQQRERQQQEQQRRRLFAEGEGANFDVYYDGVLAQPDSSNSNSSNSSSNGSSSGGWGDASDEGDSSSSSSWDGGEEEEAEEAEDWEGTADGGQQQQLLQAHAGWHQTDEQSDQQQQQQQRRQQQQERQAATQPWKPVPKRWLMNKRKQATIAAQLSGLELYGSWLGCLMQPAHVAAASGCYTPAAAAAAANGGSVAASVDPDAGAAGDSSDLSAGALV